MTTTQIALLGFAGIFCLASFLLCLAACRMAGLVNQECYPDE